MSSRVFVNAQAGRQGKTGVKKEEEWGTTTSSAEFRGYEPAEMRNARDVPRHAKTALQTSNDRGTQPKSKAPPNYTWRRFEESFPDHSACTATEQSLPKLAQGSDCRGSMPAWAKTHEKPIPERAFDHTSSYNQHQLEAQQARHGVFPYRDEFCPRSKRLLYELAHNKLCAESVASGSTATASAYTMSSQRSAARSGAARSRSEGSLAASSHHTADSARITGGIAKRRLMATFKSPALSHHDEDWFREMWEKEGPAGLTFANFKPGYYQRSCKMSVEQTHSIKALLNGKEPENRKYPPKGL